MAQSHPTMKQDAVTYCIYLLSLTASPHISTPCLPESAVDFDQKHKVKFRDRHQAGLQRCRESYS